MAAYIPGNGGALRQWMIHQTAATISPVTNAAAIFRASVGSGADIGRLLVHECVDLLRKLEAVPGRKPEG